MKEDLVKKTLWTVVALGVLVMAVAVLRGTEESEVPAGSSSSRWLTLVDSGRYAESWRAASTMFRSAVTAEQWQKALRAAREPLGALVSRKLADSRFATSLPGAPDGEYYVFQYGSEFANKKSALETVTLVKEKDGTWRVAGYFIR
jgi:Protein of unknown function (DUF4019)